MKKFDEICDDLGLTPQKSESEFRSSAWVKFKKAMEVRAVRTVQFEEAFLLWMLIQRFEPKVVLELGGQHGHSGIILADAARRVNARFITVELGFDPRNKYLDESCGTLQFLPDAPHITKVWGEATEKLTEILAQHDVDFVFHDCAHTWDHVEFCLTAIRDKNPTAIQTCHDCADGMWQPDVETRYGFVCAERPVFDKHFLNDESCYYSVFTAEKGMGLGIALKKELLSVV